MSRNNSMSFNLPEQDMEAVNRAITVLREKLMPALKSVNPETMKHLPEMGDKTLAFQLKTYEYCSANPEIIPQYIDMNEFSLDVKALELLRQLHGFLAQLTDMVHQSMLLAGCDAYANSRAAYKCVQVGKKLNIPKTGTIFDDLSARYPRRKKQKDPIITSEE
jgi:hypothetical protein